MHIKDILTNIQFQKQILKNSKVHMFIVYIGIYYKTWKPIYVPRFVEKIGLFTISDII